ncbi:hypothetical protein [Yersinia kristensenii]|uniref:hypothetical protein n=1 Tax=Yersinia kristensenii TaxID=28152 RepID=UPI0012FE58E8|nr:hypothetical protein [Yersinia kristensenii]
MTNIKKPWDVVHHHGFIRHSSSCMCVGCHHLLKSLSFSTPWVHYVAAFLQLELFRV